MAKYHYFIAKKQIKHKYNEYNNISFSKYFQFFSAKD
nr:MAG TPA: hypothetical protein [Caudoviricetes sp.]